MALFGLNLASDIAFNRFVFWNWIKVVPYSSVAIFSLATGLITYLVKRKGYEHDPISFALKLLLGDFEASRKSSFTERQQLIRNRAISEAQLHLNLIDPNGNLRVRSPSVPKSSSSSKSGPHCPHQYNCASYVISGAIRSFLIGISSQTLLALLLKPKSINANRVLELVTSSRTVRFGAFLSAFTGVFRLLNCSLRRLRGDDRDSNQLIAGLGAGMTSCLYPSSDLAMHLLWKAAQSYYCLLNSNYNLVIGKDATSVLLFAVACGQIFYCLTMEMQFVKGSYVKFLDRMTNGLVFRFNKPTFDWFGVDASRDRFDIEGMDPRFLSRRYMETMWVWMIS